MKIKFFKKSKDIKQSKTRIDFIRELGYDESHGYSLLRSSKKLPDQEHFLELAKDYDSYGYMSQALGEELDSLFEDEDYVIGIHRTGYTNMDQSTLNDMFNNGLINNGDIMGGSNSGRFNIEKTVTLFYDFLLLDGQLKSASGYKNSEGSIIVKIPKVALGKKDGKPIPIYYQKDGINRLLPKFVYGYIPVDTNGNLGNIIHNPNYKDKHTLENSNLLYDDGANSKSKFNLRNAYKETYLKYGKYQADQALIRFIKNKDVNCFTGASNRKKLIDYVDVYNFDGMSANEISNMINNFERSINFNNGIQGITK